jgi:hypothetical protein
MSKIKPIGKVKLVDEIKPDSVYFEGIRKVSEEMLKFTSEEVEGIKGRAEKIKGFAIKCGFGDKGEE